MENIIFRSAEDMKKYAADFAGSLSGGTILALTGELGSGKTTFVQGLAKGFGVPGAVNSPTFNIMKLYNTGDSCEAGPDSEGTVKRLYHIDCYRLDNPHDLAGLGFHEWIKDAEGVVAIEWAEKIREILPSRAIRFRFEAGEESERKMIIENDPRK